MRKVAGAVLGLALAAVIVAGMDWFAHWLFPPAAVDLRGLLSIDAAPMPARVLVAGSWFLGALVGGLVAVRVSAWPSSIWIVSGLAAAACLAMTMLIPHPLWMQVAAVAGPLFAAVVARTA